MKAHEYESRMRFRVLAEGCRIIGMTYAYSGAYNGGSHALQAGEIVTCLGMRMGWGSDSVQYVQFEATDDASGKPVLYGQFVPGQGGMWGGMPPRDGTVELVEG